MPRARQPTNLVPGNSYRLSPNEGCSHARRCTGHLAARSFIQTQSPSPSQSISEDSGPHGLCVFGTSVGPASHAAPSVLPETSSSSTRLATRTPCVAALDPWKNNQWIERGVSLVMVCRRKVVSTDTSNLGWGMLCDGKPAFGLWLKKEGYLHINCLEMLANTLPPLVYLQPLDNRRAVTLR